MNLLFPVLIRIGTENSKQFVFCWFQIELQMIFNVGREYMFFPFCGKARGCSFKYTRFQCHFWSLSKLQLISVSVQEWKRSVEKGFSNRFCTQMEVDAKNNPPLFFACGPEGCYHTLNVITISLYVRPSICVCKVGLTGGGSWTHFRENDQ